MEFEIIKEEPKYSEPKIYSLPPALRIGKSEEEFEIIEYPNPYRIPSVVGVGLLLNLVISIIIGAEVGTYLSITFFILSLIAFLVLLIWDATAFDMG